MKSPSYIFICWAAVIKAPTKCPFGNHHVGAKILSYACQIVLTLAFFVDATKEMGINDIFTPVSAMLAICVIMFTTLYLVFIMFFLCDRLLVTSAQGQRYNLK